MVPGIDKLYQLIKSFSSTSRFGLVFVINFFVVWLGIPKIFVSFVYESAEGNSAVCCLSPPGRLGSVIWVVAVSLDLNPSPAWNVLISIVISDLAVGVSLRSSPISVPMVVYFLTVDKIALGTSVNTSILEVFSFNILEIDSVSLADVGIEVKDVVYI